MKRAAPATSQAWTADAVEAWFLSCHAEPGALPATARRRRRLDGWTARSLQPG